MSSSKIRYLSLVVSCLLSAIIAFVLYSPEKQIDVSRVERCLLAYSEYQSSGDQKLLQKSLDTIPIDMKSFEKVIDRVLYYRLRQSSMDQAFALLEAFKSGRPIIPDGCELTDLPKDYFQLDAEVLELFQKKPDFVKSVFKS
ncbi:MAG: hypothetical protein HQM10_00850 [Candidatus Riflebacteria bacterium]|nr:hypothetical protein [Candidatus Riflebacteria bacterium]